MGSDEGAGAKGRSYAGAVAGQSSVGRDRAQTGLPLRSDKTVTWASVLEQAFNDRALVESRGSGEHRHLVGLGLDLGRRRGGGGSQVPLQPVQEGEIAAAAEKASTSAPAATTTTTTSATWATATVTTTVTRKKDQ